MNGRAVAEGVRDTARTVRGDFGPFTLYDRHEFRGT